MKVGFGYAVRPRAGADGFHLIQTGFMIAISFFHAALPFHSANCINGK